MCIIHHGWKKSLDLWWIDCWKMHFLVKDLLCPQGKISPQVLIIIPPAEKITCSLSDIIFNVSPQRNVGHITCILRDKQVSTQVYLTRLYRYLWYWKKWQSHSIISTLPFILRVGKFCDQFWHLFILAYLRTKTGEKVFHKTEVAIKTSIGQRNNNLWPPDRLKILPTFWGPHAVSSNIFESLPHHTSHLFSASK